MPPTVRGGIATFHLSPTLRAHDFPTLSLMSNQLSSSLHIFNIIIISVIEIANKTKSSAYIIALKQQLLMKHPHPDSRNFTKMSSTKIENNNGLRTPPLSG